MSTYAKRILLISFGALLLTVSLIHLFMSFVLTSGMSGPGETLSHEDGSRAIVLGVVMLGTAIGCLYYAWHLKKNGNGPS